MPARAIATSLPTVLTGSPAPTLPAIASLTLGLASGNEAAYREFHARYFDRLLRYHLVLARGDELSARDALQETLTRVARKARRFDDETIFWSWLTVVARSTAVDGGRRRSRYGALLRRFTLLLRPEPVPTGDSDSHLHEQLERALATLEPEDRALIEAKYFGAASVHHLAEQRGVTEKAVESRLLRLRRQLRESILNSLRHDESN